MVSHARSRRQASGAGVDRSSCSTLEPPPVAPDGVLVRVRAAGFNPVDAKIREGQLAGAFPHHFPVILGWDAAGVVERVGPAVTWFKPGDEVYGYCRRHHLQYGTFAEYTTVPEGYLAHMPPSLSFEEAAAIPLSGLTAHQSLEALGLRGGETLFLDGGAGGVGHLAIQLAVARGARVIATASAAQPRLPARARRGAGRLHARRRLRARARRSRGRRAPTPRSTSSAATRQEQAFSVLRRGGRIVSIVARRRAAAGFEIHYIFVRPSGYDLGEMIRRWSHDGRPAPARRADVPDRGGRRRPSSTSRTGTCAASSCCASTDRRARARRRPRQPLARLVGERACGRRPGPGRDALGRGARAPRERRAAARRRRARARSRRSAARRPGRRRRARRRRRRSYSARRVMRTSRSAAAGGADQRRHQVVARRPRQLDVLGGDRDLGRLGRAAPRSSARARRRPRRARRRAGRRRGGRRRRGLPPGRVGHGELLLPDGGETVAQRVARLVQPGLDGARRDVQVGGRLGVGEAGEVERARPRRAGRAAASRSPRGSGRRRRPRRARRRGPRTGRDVVVACESTGARARVRSAWRQWLSPMPVSQAPKRSPSRSRSSESSAVTTASCAASAAPSGSLERPSAGAPQRGRVPLDERANAPGRRRGAADEIGVGGSH